MQSTANIDRAATALSLTCVAHCVALPLIAIALPFVAAVAEAEWVHWTLALLAVVTSGTVLARAHDARTPTFAVPALIGIALITGALFAENFGFNETIPTVIGGVLLATAHTYRLFQHK